MNDTDRWASERLELADGKELMAVLARVDYIAWNSDHRDSRRASVAEVNRAVAGAGGVRGFVKVGAKRMLVFRGIALLPERGTAPVRWRPDSDEVAATEEEVVRSLTALYDHGLVRGTRTLDIAYLRLTGAPAKTCGICGVITRHHNPPYHAACLSLHGRRQGSQPVRGGPR